MYTHCFICHHNPVMWVDRNWLLYFSQRKLRELKKHVECDTALTGRARIQIQVSDSQARSLPTLYNVFLKGKNGLKDDVIHWSVSFFLLVKWLLYHIFNSHTHGMCFWDFFSLPNINYISNPAWISCCFNHFSFRGYYNIWWRSSPLPFFLLPLSFS